MIENNIHIHGKLACKYDLPELVVELICRSPFKFASEKIFNADIKSIMFAYLGKLKIKKQYEKEE